VIEPAIPSSTRRRIVPIVLSVVTFLGYYYSFIAFSHRWLATRRLVPLALLAEIVGLSVAWKLALYRRSVAIGFLIVFSFELVMLSVATEVWLGARVDHQ
jgi:apolipoprotein N-acyltransferase